MEQPSWVYGLWRFLLQNVALMPLLGVVGYIALVMADDRYDKRYSTKQAELEIRAEQVVSRADRIQLRQTDVQVNADVTHLKDDLREVKENTRAINDKLDRLMIYNAVRDNRRERER